MTDRDDARFRAARRAASAGAASAGTPEPRVAAACPARRARAAAPRPSGRRRGRRPGPAPGLTTIRGRAPATGRVLRGRDRGTARRPRARRRRSPQVRVRPPRWRPPARLRPRATGRHRPATGTARRRGYRAAPGYGQAPPVYGPPGAAGLRHRPGARADRRTGRPRAAGGVVGWAAVDQRGRGGRLAPGHRRRLLGARRARRRRRRRVRSARRVRAGHLGSHRPLGPGHDAARRVVAGRPRPGGHAARGARHGRRHLHAAAERRPRTLPRAVRQGPVLGRRGVGRARAGGRGRLGAPCQGRAHHARLPRRRGSSG